jgi:hypothetical protein
VACRTPASPSPASISFLSLDVGDRFICADVLSLTAEFIASFDFVWSSPALPIPFGN